MIKGGGWNEGDNVLSCSSKSRKLYPPLLCQAREAVNVKTWPSQYNICVDIKERCVLDVRDTSHWRRDSSLDFPWNIYDEQRREREFHKLRNLKQKQIVRWTPKLTKKMELNLVCFSFPSLLCCLINTSENSPLTRSW